MVASSSFWGLVTYASIAYAGLCKPSGDICSEIKSLLGDEAVSLCSSYLQATPATVTVTSTTTRTSFQTIAAPPETISTSVEETTTVSVTNIEVVIPPIPTVTITRTLSVSTVYLYRPNQTRDDSLETVLASLEKKYSKAAVTAGCRCVYDPFTETITHTTDATIEATSQVTIGPSTTVIVTKIKYIPVTKATDITVTGSPRWTYTERVTTVTTMNPTYFRPATCNVRGNYRSEDGSGLDTDIDLKTCMCRYVVRSFAETGFSDPRSYYIMNDKDCPS
ncbi:hypothetical protein HYE68_007615 [Fusarium pseudograminearum]|nr:hypothetical protein HYE68_007615 [Fusarium pseudograminearum]